MSEIIKRPEIRSVDFCVDENIWGHRLYDEQLPHLTVLEFLGVLGSNLDRPLRPHEGAGGGAGCCGGAISTRDRAQRPRLGEFMLSCQ